MNYIYNFLDIFLISVVLFVIGVWGIFVVRKNIIIMLMSLEIMLFAVNLNFIFFSVYLDDIMGQVMAILVLTVAASESAIGLAILVVYYRLRGVINIDEMRYLKG